jgi:hypothetical protein
MKVEGPDGITKAKNGAGRRKAIKAEHHGEARSRLESLAKRRVHSDNHGIRSVSDPCTHEGPVVVGQDMRMAWSVKPLLAPRKVEGSDGITNAKDGTGQRKVLRANPHSKEPHQRIHARPRSHSEECLVFFHSDNHGSNSKRERCWYQRPWWPLPKWQKAGRNTTNWSERRRMNIKLAPALPQQYMIQTFVPMSCIHPS